jgi:2-dehydro-3-deoxyphosphogluconate aldolase/(4S)-4-hydroxy-2-oxoglutarate aldolase
MSQSSQSTQGRDGRSIQEGLPELLAASPVIPVVTIAKLSDAVPLAKALVAGGLPVLEITLRTDCAVEAMAKIAREVEGALVGAGTVLNAGQLARVEAAGARFAVSPGATERLLDAAAQSRIPLLPGAATAGEAMRLLERDYRFMKFFPAVPAGGIPYLSSLAAPLPEVRFCPTGGITAETAPAFLALKNVACVGGSWMLPAAAIQAGDWARIAELSRAAASLGRAGPG